MEKKKSIKLDNSTPKIKRASLSIRNSYAQSKFKLRRHEAEKQRKQQDQTIDKTKDFGSLLSPANYESPVSDLQQKLQIEMLNIQVTELMKEKAEMEIRMNVLRSELRKYKDIEEQTQTPVIQKSYRNSLVNLFRTPLRSFSKSTLSPFGNASRTSLAIDSGNPPSGELSQAASGHSMTNLHKSLSKTSMPFLVVTEGHSSENSDNDEVFDENRLALPRCQIETVPIFDARSLNTSPSLLNYKKNHRLSKDVKHFFTHLIPCVGCDIKERNELSPPAFHLQSPCNATYATVNIQNINTGESSQVIINTPVSESTFLLNHSVKSSKKTQNYKRSSKSKGSKKP